jgi:hypothetical protein
MQLGISLTSFLKKDLTHFEETWNVGYTFKNLFLFFKAP